MNFTLLRALLALWPALVLVFGALVLYRRGKAFYFLLQLFGAGCLVLVPVTHVAEALHLFPWMHWGLEHSPGHYLDLCGAALGLTFSQSGIYSMPSQNDTPKLSPHPCGTHSGEFLAGIGGDAASNLIRKFILKRFTAHVSKGANGKP
jgi:hypothetical protein